MATAARRIALRDRTNGPRKKVGRPSTTGIAADTTILYTEAAATTLVAVVVEPDSNVVVARPANRMMKQSVFGSAVIETDEEADRVNLVSVSGMGDSLSRQSVTCTIRMNFMA